MKKFLLSLIALAGATIMNAESVTFDFVTEAYGLERGSDKYIDNGTKLPVTDGVEVTLTKTEGKNGWRLWNDGLRAYKSSGAGMTITATGHKITKVTYTVVKNKIAGYTVNGGAETTVDASATEFSFAADSETINVGFNVSNNGAIASMVVELDGEGGGVDPNPNPDPDPDPITTEGDGTEAKPYTVADVIALDNTKPAAAWVKGYIVGAMNSNNEYTFEVTAPFAVASNVYIADSDAETETAKMLPIQLVNGSAIRKAVNLVDNPGNVGKLLTIKGSLEKYFGQPGVKSPTDYKLDGEGSGDDNNGVPTSGPGSEEQPYTIAEAIALNNNGSYGWVNGYIVGSMAYDEAEKKNYFSDTEFVNTNIVIAATTADFGTEYIAVQLPAGKIREDLNLVDRPGNLGKEVSVCGQFVKYCGVNGVKETSKYSIVGGVAPLPVGETPSLTTFVEEQSETNLKITGTVTVYYQSPDKKYTFITDGETNLEVYGQMEHAYTNGDQLTGIIGKYGFYQNMPQMTPQLDSFGEPTAGTPVQPKNVAINQVGIADYVVVEKIEIVEVDGKFYVGEGADQRQLFDRFALGQNKAGVATITGIGAIYGETKQIFPISIDFESSISEITAGEKAAEIFDLQGRKVANPTRGFYIVGGQKKFIR